MSQYDKMFLKIVEAEENGVVKFSYLDEDGEEIVVQIVPHPMLNMEKGDML